MSSTSPAWNAQAAARVAAGLAPGVSPVGRLVFAYRTAHGLTQGDVARAANMTPAMVSRLETGSRTRLNATGLAELAEAMDLTREELRSLYLACGIVPPGMQRDAQQAVVALAEKWEDDSDATFDDDRGD